MSGGNGGKSGSGGGDDARRAVKMGDSAWRWELARGVDRRALLAALRALPGAVDAVVAEAHACVVVEPGAPAPDFAAAERASAALGAPPAREHVIRVRYDGADLAELAARAGLTPDEVAARHAARVYTVSLVGFLPGFAYLREVDPSIDAPRRATPRARVPAGAVALAAGYTGVYPFASPGGWNLVGTAVDFTAFDAERGARLALGDRVRFEAAR